MNGFCELEAVEVFMPPVGEERVEIAEDLEKRSAVGFCCELSELSRLRLRES
jgi:hypothetical protein